ncbi:MAG: hypothetical protein HYX32_04470 [Actinobacteria bacterium]|nr:hypothetical protein [Actinomycetota bacterium]
MAARTDSYWPNSPWPGEDGGPLRQQAPAPGGAALDITGSPAERVHTVSRPAFAATMCVTRQHGEVFVQGHTMGGDTTSWVERIHPESLETLRRTDDLPGGPFWPGGLAAHANGSLYATYGRWCHRLDPHSLKVMSARELPRDRPYNSLVITSSGHLVMKDIGGARGGGLELPGGAHGSELVVLDPENLDILATHELPEGSIARLSADGDTVDAVGVTRVRRRRWDLRNATHTPDDTWSPLYRQHEGQTFGWDIVLADGSGWFLDNGEGSAQFGGCFRGKTASSAPLHLVRVSLDDDTTTLTEVCGEPGGLIVNPPSIDTTRKIVVGYDSGHGVMTAWRYRETSTVLEHLWTREQNHAGHMLSYPETGELVTYDYDQGRALDQVVVLDMATGEEKARVDTPSPIQSVVFPCAGWGRDVYTMTMTTLSRLWVE